MKKLIFFLFALVLIVACKEQKLEPYEPCTENLIGDDASFISTDTTNYLIHNCCYPRCGVELNLDHEFTWQASVDGGTTWATIPNANYSGYWIPKHKAVTTKYKRVINLPACAGNESNIITITIIPAK